MLRKLLLLVTAAALAAVPLQAPRAAAAHAAAAPGGGYQHAAPAPAKAAAAQAAPRFNALVFTKTAGFRHPSIPDAVSTIEQLGTEHNFTVDHTEDATVFNEENLEGYDVVIFASTTGDVLNADQQAAFQHYIRSGGGYMGIHAAADTEYDWAWYGKLVGAYFDSHPAVQQGTVKVLDGTHPATAGLPERWQRTDEWYNYRTNPRGDVHVLATLDETTYDPGSGSMGTDHPIAWCHDYDGGRSFYTGGGHTPESYSEPLFRQHLLGGIETAAGAAAAECGGTEWSNFDKVQLDDATEQPMKLAVAEDGRVFYLERVLGEVRVYDPESQTTEVAGQLDVFSEFENGLMGIALDPDFTTNGWVYLYYSAPGTVACPPTDPGASACGLQRLSRFTMSGNTLDMNSEQVLLEVPHQRDECCHESGDLEFDPQGNLYLSTGDDTNPFASDGYAPTDERDGRSTWDAQRSAANTNDLRGKVLRIHPEQDGTYTIPQGNLFPEAQDPGDKTRPEIYAMGFRNPFTVEIDPATGALAVADYGPDANSADPDRGPDGRVEWNLVQEAGNYGWPYCVSENTPYHDFDFATQESGPEFDCADPVNDSPNNTGLTQLPQAKPATLWYGRSATGAQEIGFGGGPMAGPIYRFDESLASERKLPEYYDGSWFFLEFTNHELYEFKLDGSSDVLKVNPFLTSTNVKAPMDMEVGPDGALYLIEWGSGPGSGDSGLYRIDYVKGSRAPIANAEGTPTSGSVPLTVEFSSQGSRDADGDPISYAWDFDGDGSVDSTEPNPSHTYTEAGDYTAQLTVTDESGKTGVANVQIAAGNNEPEIDVRAPVDGGFFDFGDEVAFDVTVTDQEDGSTEDGSIDCSEVAVQVALGHDAHGHPFERYHGCSGKIQTAKDDGHSEAENLYYVVEVSYTDSGAQGVSPLTGRETHILQPKRKQAENFTRMSGVRTEATSDPQGGGENIGFIEDGDWISYEPVNLRNIEALDYRIASGGAGGRIEVHAGSPDGPVISDSGQIEPTGGWQTWKDVTVPVEDPGGTNELFFVFKSSEGGGGLFNLNWIDFHGKGVSVNAKPRIDVSADPTSGGVPLTVDFAATAADPEGEQVTFDWDFGDGATGSGAEVSHTYEEQETFTATVTATDASGATATETVEIEVLPPASPPIVCDDPDRDPPPGDEFDGDRLDGCRWDAVVRPDYNRFRVQGGALEIDTTPTNLFDGSNNAPNLMLQTWPDENWVVETKITAPVCEQWQQGGLLVYASDRTFLKLDYVGTAPPGDPCSRKIEMRHEIDDVFQPAFPEADIPAEAGDTWYLRLAKEGSTYTGYYSADGENFTKVGAITNEALGGADVGVYAFGQEQTQSVTARFDYFHKLSDSQPPTVSAQVDPAEPDGANGWYVSAPQVTLAADDGGGSGVDAVEYSLDGGAWTSYDSPLTIGEDGVHRLRYRATDGAGNVSDVEKVTVKVDRSSPRTTADVRRVDADGDGYTTHAKVTLQAADPVSGVAATEYRVDGGAWTAYESPFAVRGMGDHTVAFRSRDAAGNVEPERQVRVRLSGDACPASDMRDHVWTGDVDSGVDNRDTGDGCTVNDLIRDDASWRSHGAFVDHVDRVTDDLVASGVLEGRAKGRIMRSAARSDVGR